MCSYCCIFTLCRWRRQHSCGVVLASWGWCPALPILWFPLQAGAPPPPPLTLAGPSCVIVDMHNTAACLLFLLFHYNPATFRTRQIQCQTKPKIWFYSPPGSECRDICFLVFTYDFLSDLSLTCSARVLDLPANLISLCFRCFSEGSHVGHTVSFIFQLNITLGPLTP